MHSSIPKSCFDLVIFNKSPCCSEVFVQLCVLESTKWTPIFVSRSSHGFGILPSSWMTCAPTGTNFSFCPWPNATTLQWKRATLGIFTLPVDQILSVPPNPTLVPKRVALAKPWRVPCPSRWSAKLWRKTSWRRSERIWETNSFERLIHWGFSWVFEPVYFHSFTFRHIPLYSLKCFFVLVFRCEYFFKAVFLLATCLIWYPSFAWEF